MSKQEITEKQKIDIEVSSKYLEVRAKINNSIITEFLNSSAVFWKHAIQGLFLLHGACATAIIASGNVAQFKWVLVALAFGAVTTVIGSLLISSAHWKYSLQYIEAVMLVDLQLFENIQSIYSKNFYDHIQKTRKLLPRNKSVDVFKYPIIICWISIIIFLFAIWLFLVYC